MKNTNEIEKQLERKANAYLEQKANEMIAIRKQIERMLDIETNYANYITDYDAYCEAEEVDKNKFVDFENWSVVQNKLIDELSENYKQRLIKKYTTELLTKLDIFE